MYVPKPLALRIILHFAFPFGRADTINPPELVSYKVHIMCSARVGNKFAKKWFIDSITLRMYDAAFKGDIGFVESTLYQWTLSISISASMHIKFSFKNIWVHFQTKKCAIF
jgi:hypothetical protein